MISKRRVWISFGTLAALPLTAAGQNLEGVMVKGNDKGVSVLVQGSDLSKPKEIHAMNGHIYILEFSAGMSGKSKKIPVDKAGLNSVSYGWFSAKPKKVRVAFRLGEGAQPKLAQSADGWQVSLGNEEAAPAEKSEEKKAPAETFPETVPPIDGKPVDGKPAISESAHAVKKDETPKADKKISLDFVNTDVVQILKALALQAQVNILTSPDVKGAITVNLDNVTVDQALRLVTSIAGLQFSKQGNAYVVAPAGKLNSIIKQIGDDGGAITDQDHLLETRVIDIYSGDANPIRAAILSSLNKGELAMFNIQLPSDTFSINRKDTGDKPGGPEVETKTGSETQKETKGAVETGKTTSNISYRGLKEQYLIVIGPRKGMDEVAKRIREIDELVAKSYGLKNTGNSELVRKTYSIKSSVTASDLVTMLAVAAEGNKFNVDVYASPKEFINQSIVIVGRIPNVERVEAMLRDIDVSGYGDELKVYDVKYSDPRSLRESLVAQVKGIRATVGPSAAGTPQLFQEGKTRQQSAEVTSPATANGTAAQTNAASNGAVSTGVVDDAALEQPYLDMEKVAAPMRLILRGTKAQIEEGLKYLSQVDTPPKQVAIEVRVMELTREEAVKAGVDWNILTGGAVSFLKFANGQTGTDIANTGQVSITNGKANATVTASLDKLATKNNLIARPNLIAMDGRNSEIFVGDVVRYIESITTSQNGPTITTGKIPVGMRLSLLPRVGADGTITLDLRPRLSILTSFTAVPGGGQLPQTSTRFAQSTLAMESGETIAIGGLIQDQDRNTVSGIPVLMDLPLIGQLFRKTTKDRIRTEVVIFLTAKSIDGAVKTNHNYLPMQKDMKQKVKKG